MFQDEYRRRTVTSCRCSVANVVDGAGRLGERYWPWKGHQRSVVSLVAMFLTVMASLSFGLIVVIGEGCRNLIPPEFSA